MSITSTYRSLSEENTWARHVAGRVHQFYDDVLEFLDEKYEDWYMETSWSEAGPLGIALHLFALDELKKARVALNHPTMQLHEFAAATDLESFAERFKESFDRGDYTARANKEIRDNIRVDLQGDARLMTARALVERYGDLLWQMDDETFAERWLEVWTEISFEAQNYRATWGETA